MLLRACIGLLHLPRLVAAVIEERATTVPKPIALAASQDWDGNDGSWSSFVLQVGTPPQVVKVFPGTSAYATYVVLPEGCIETDPSNCDQLRGGLFQANESSTWVKNTANLSTDIYPLRVGTALGYNGRARFGFDDVTLGWQGAGGPSLRNQTIGSFVTKDSFLGIFGLSARASNFTSFVDPIPSFMQNLRNASLIPSTSWAYTAGNRYRLNSVLGSLTLGGYDRSKFVAHDVTWPFNSEDIRDLTVQIESITMSDNSTQSSLLPSAIPAFLDSSLPYIWLPEEACTLFENAFNLTWDNTSNFYLLSDFQHDALLSQNANITFTLGNLTAGVNINITLPYAAFDLTASPPLVANATRYFPLKRGANQTQYVLGRTFFQEAYVIADYERRNFSVSPCNWEAGLPQDLATIDAPSEEEIQIIINGTSGSPLSGGSSSVPTGAIAGGVVGGVAAIIGLAILLWYFCIKPRRHAAEAAQAAALANEPDPPVSAPPAVPGDLTVHKAELGDDAAERIHEMEGKKNTWVVETDGREVEIHELPAREEVATEMMGLGNSAELMGQGNSAELETPPANPRFSWIHTPIDEPSGSSTGPPPRWSWITSPGGAPSSDEKDGLSSPGSEVPPASLRAQLARLPE